MPIQAPRSSATCQNPRNIGSILQGSVKKSGQKTQEIILNQEGRFLYILAMIGISCFRKMQGRHFGNAPKLLGQKDVVGPGKFTITSIPLIWAHMKDLN